MPSRVLLIGNDGMLLTTRAEILQREGFLIEKVLGIPELRLLELRGIAVVILCHSLSAEQMSKAISIVRNISPNAMVLRLSQHDNENVMPEHASAVVSGGPTRLISVTTDLAKRWSESVEVLSPPTT